MILIMFTREDLQQGGPLELVGTVIIAVVGNFSASRLLTAKERTQAILHNAGKGGIKDAS